ncbi:MAG: glycine cleavage system aminomethyltransferase GcvT [Candidatus Marinimicrobia bacterium]|nr:glycine cleavage system aminomethyltransferase GcvT [Candidatus Neomarinimicrobiota bacterium]MCF7827450.1 glycine cleavage system aminomethyltransferase GcvT [Candidatus Neomarinimicrobiota bacterium]MCF7882325.1 glycine cleavage system aminomethyltransferase GcvT [Candidatus Neomarinimicrobiota bacterium]
MPKKTALYDVHESLGAKIVDFAGYKMPIQYEGIISEHNRVRTTVGIFDISHMGEFMVTGSEAEGFLNYVTINDVSKMSAGQAQYTAMCLEDGGIVDDLLIYKYEDRYMVVVNAANIEKDWGHMQKHLQSGDDVELKNVSDDVTLLAVQGPESRALVQQLTEHNLNEIKFYHFVEGEASGVPATISRTGYTGEMGFELYVENEYAADLWNALFQVGAKFEAEPVGLGARDTLRLEAGLCLYGNDIDESTNPIEAGLGWITKLGKEDFVGKSALEEVRENGVERKRIGFKLLKRGIPRHGYPITFSGREVGEVTSGNQSPMLEKGIGMGYVKNEFAEIDTVINIKVRNRELPAKVAKMPFYTPDYNVRG